METYTTCKSTYNHFSKRAGYCSLNNKNMTVNSKTGHIKFCFHKRRERFAFTVKKYKFDKPRVNQIDDMLKAVIKDCKHKYFHNFEYRCENI